MDAFYKKPLRIVLVGNSVKEKNATANTILGERIFKSRPDDIPESRRCQKASRKWKDRELLVVNTPGFFDKDEELDTTCKEISRCTQFCEPGPHAIVIVLKLNEYTEEDQKTLAMIKALFGDSATKYMIILFTQKEDLGKRSLMEFVENSDVTLRNMVKECGNRCCAFNNIAGKSEREAQVQELVQLIEKMMYNNTHFPDDLNKDIKKRQNNVLEALEKICAEKLEKQIKAVENEYTNTLQEKEEKIKELKEQHAAHAKNIRDNQDNLLFKVVDVFKKMF